ncbi:hypothetical protein H1R20_g6930, partial [Candolleomyces eurysporus]
MKVLGRIIDDKGIKMDPDKVDLLMKWKTPTSRELLCGFLSAAGYLSDNIPERAFEEVNSLTSRCREHHRVPLDYGKDAQPINMVTDACASGLAGVVSQGDNWRTAKVAAFFSAKLNKAQQNYLVHEQEMLASVETMMRHQDILQGVKFCWYTDHKGLIHLLKQRDLSGRQAWWMEKISTFNFEVIYVPGVDNILSDALSRIYSYDALGTVHAPGEYTEHDDTLDLPVGGRLELSMLVLVGKEGAMPVMPEANRRQQVVALNVLTRLMAGKKAGTSEPAAVASGGRAVVVENKGKSPAEDEDTITMPHARGAVTKKRQQQVEMKEAVKPAAKEPKKRQGRPRKVVELAETGGPETGMEFAKRMKRHFVLKGPKAPGEQREGGSQEKTNDAPIQHKAPSAIAENGSEHFQSESQPSSEELSPPNLVQMVDNATDGMDIPAVIRNKYQDDPFFDEILKNLRHYKNFKISEGLIYLTMDEKHVLCIPRVTHQGRNIREFVINEAHSILAHLGFSKTLTYLRNHVWWNDMVKDTKRFCETCVTCMRNKSSNHKPYGLLHPLQPPSQPWDSIGIDFIGPLPTSENRDSRFDMITDGLTGMNPILNVDIENLQWINKDIFRLKFHEDFTNKTENYSAQQLKPFIEVSEKIEGQWKNGEELKVEVFGGYNEFARRYNCFAGACCLLVRNQLGAWEVPVTGRFLTSHDIDLSLLEIQRAVPAPVTAPATIDPTLEALGFTHNGVACTSMVHKHIKEKQTMINTQSLAIRTFHDLYQDDDGPFNNHLYPSREGNGGQGHGHGHGCGRGGMPGTQGGHGGGHGGIPGPCSGEHGFRFHNKLRVFNNTPGIGVENAHTATHQAIAPVKPIASVTATVNHTTGTMPNNGGNAATEPFEPSTEAIEAAMASARDLVAECGRKDGTATGTTTKQLSELSFKKTNGGVPGKDTVQERPTQSGHVGTDVTTQQVATSGNSETNADGGAGIVSGGRSAVNAGSSDDDVEMGGGPN